MTPSHLVCNRCSGVSYALSGPTSKWGKLVYAAVFIVASAFALRELAVRSAFLFWTFLLVLLIVSVGIQHYFIHTKPLQVAPLQIRTRADAIKHLSTAQGLRGLLEASLFFCGIALFAYFVIYRFR